MKKLLLSFTFLCGTLGSFAQDYSIGKTIAEVYASNKSLTCHDNFKVRGMKTLHFMISETTTDVYFFNDRDICVEYERVVMNTSLETVTINYLADFFPNGNSFERYDKLKAQIIEFSKDVYGIRFYKTTL